MTSSQLLSICVGLAVLLISVEPFAGEKNSKEGQNRQPTTDSAMTQLQASFRKAGSPRASDLLGTWVLTRSVSTQKFIDGHEGQDHVQFNIEGIRREGKPGNPLEWTLTFRNTNDGRLQVTSDTVWEPSGDISSVNFSSL